MYKLLPILLFALAFCNEDGIQEGEHTLKNSYVTRAELELESDNNIHGIQFDIIYNPLEITSITPLQIRGYEVVFQTFSDSLIRGLIFSKQGKELPEIIEYDFVNANGFNGISTVQFVDFIAADSNGNNIAFPKVKSYDIDFSIYSTSDNSDEKIINKIQLNRDDIYVGSWAVIIGIDKYKYSDQLNYAVKDAEAVKEMLINKFDYNEEYIRYLTDEEATLSNIKLNLGEVATSAGEDDRILVFYSGHGETLKGADGSETGYIIPYEGRQDNPYATGLVMDEILRTCQISQSKHMLFLMDACYSGLMTENVKGLAKPQEEGYLSKVANEKARQIITAGGRDEQVIERDEWQHSAFTKNLLEGLESWGADYNKDGCITADELSTYLRENVTEDSDFQQTPQDGRFRNSGGGEFVFFSDATVTIPSSDTAEEDEMVYGCMDENASNYNPNATNPDRSCHYGKLVTSLEFGEIIKINKIIGTDINIPDGKTGENYVDGYFIVYEIPVIINNNFEIAGFQFDIDGGNIIQASGGIAEEYGFMTSHSESMVLSYSVNGDVFPRSGNQVLLDLQIEPIWYTSIIGTTGVVTTKYKEVCIQEITLADKDAQRIESTSFDCFKPVFPSR